MGRVAPRGLRCNGGDSNFGRGQWRGAGACPTSGGLGRAAKRNPAARGCGDAPQGDLTACQSRPGVRDGRLGLTCCRSAPSPRPRRVRATTRRTATTRRAIPSTGTRAPGSARGPRRWGSRGPSIRTRSARSSRGRCRTAPGPSSASAARTARSRTGRAATSRSRRPSRSRSRPSWAATSGSSASTTGR